MFNSRFDVVNGGLASYGPDFVDLFRRAAGYVDPSRAEAGRPAGADMVKYELAINLRTANAMGLTLSRKLLTRADEVIE